MLVGRCSVFILCLESTNRRTVMGRAANAAAAGVVAGSDFDVDASVHNFVVFSIHVLRQIRSLQ